MRLGVLGPLLIRHEDSAISVPAARQRAVLAVLLVNANRVVSADELADVVWDGAPPPAARVTVRGYIRRLRRLLGPAVCSRIATRSLGYAAEFDPVELDLLRFAELCRDGGAALRAGSWTQSSDALGEALGLWRGTPLSDVPCERLQREDVPRLDRMRLQAAEWRAEAELRLGRHDLLVAELQSLAAEQPLRERFHAQLMIALARCGRQAEALAAYQQARRSLVAELGVEPGPELRHLHQQILRRDPDLAFPALARGAHSAASMGAARVIPRQLPSSIRHFSGRATELRALAVLLEETAGDDGAVVVSAIGGTAGVGKTALAVQFARQAAGGFGDGQLYVNLRGFGPVGTPVTPAEAIRGFLDAFETPAGAGPGRAGRAGRAVPQPAGRKAGPSGAGQRSRRPNRSVPLLPVGPGCLVIVTSRSQLAGLATTDGARLLTLDVLTEDEARELLGRNIGRARAAAEPDAVTELTRLCVRLPLALAIAAARADSPSCIPVGRPDGRATRCRRAARRPGYRRPGLQRAGGVLLVLREAESGHGADVPAAWPAPGPRHHRPRRRQPGRRLGPPGTHRQLRELTRCHLLAEPVLGRYAFHDLLRAYAAEQAAAMDDEMARRAALARALDHYLHTAHAAALLLNPLGEPITLAPAAARRHARAPGRPPAGRSPGSRPSTTSCSLPSAWPPRPGSTPAPGSCPGP